jgi:hypothetical protein
MVKETDHYAPVGGSTHSINSSTFDEEENCISITGPLNNTTPYSFDKRWFAGTRRFRRPQAGL